MMKTVKSIWIMCIVLFMKGCTNGHHQEEDFIGVWKSDDGAKVELKEDLTFTATQMNTSNIGFTGENQISKVDFIGKWEFTTDMYQKRVIKIDSDKYIFDFYISGQGMFENKPPWDLYIWIGDPDDLNKYKFVQE